MPLVTYASCNYTIGHWYNYSYDGFYHGACMHAQSCMDALVNLAAEPFAGRATRKHLRCNL